MDLRERVVALIKVAAQTARHGLWELDHLVVGEMGLESGTRCNRGNGCNSHGKLGKVDYVGYMRKLVGIGTWLKCVSVDAVLDVC